MGRGMKARRLADADAAVPPCRMAVMRQAGADGARAHVYIFRHSMAKVWMSYIPGPATTTASRLVRVCSWSLLETAVGPVVPARNLDDRAIQLAPTLRCAVSPRCVMSTQVLLGADIAELPGPRPDARAF